MGNKLFSEITNLTGLPEELIGEELKELLAQKGVCPEQMTMESLREALSEYLTQIHSEVESTRESTSLETKLGVTPAKVRFPTQ